jgi:hypothetical protein
MCVPDGIPLCGTIVVVAASSISKTHDRLNHGDTNGDGDTNEDGDTNGDEDTNGDGGRDRGLNEDGHGDRELHVDRITDEVVVTLRWGVSRSP